MNVDIVKYDNALSSGSAQMMMSKGKTTTGGMSPRTLQALKKISDEIPTSDMD